jgi:hypothetical protein
MLDAADPRLLVLAFGLPLLFALPVQGQDGPAPPTDSTRQGGGGGFFAVGVNATDLAPLNDRLRQAGYPTFPAEMLSVGGGGYGVVAGRLLLGGEGYGLIAPSRGYQGRTVSVGGGYGLFTVGYQFRPTTDLRVHPLVGIGGGGLTLEIGSAGGQTFDDVLADPDRSATLERGSLLVSLGAGLEYRFRARSDGGPQVGLRLGYLLSPYDTDWTEGDTRLAGGPDASFQGPFVRVLFGGWGGR